jgi:hypothetical protein
MSIIRTNVDWEAPKNALLLTILFIFFIGSAIVIWDNRRTPIKYSIETLSGEERCLVGTDTSDWSEWSRCVGGEKWRSIDRYPCKPLTEKKKCSPNEQEYPGDWTECNSEGWQQRDIFAKSGQEEKRIAVEERACEKLSLSMRDKKKRVIVDNFVKAKVCFKDDVWNYFDIAAIKWPLRQVFELCLFSPSMPCVPLNDVEGIRLKKGECIIASGLSNNYLLDKGISSVSGLSSTLGCDVEGWFVTDE